MPSESNPISDGILKCNPKSIIQQIGFSYTFTKLDKENAPQTTSYVLDYLKHKININLVHLVFIQKVEGILEFYFL